jgi:hypothetical protein
VKMIAYLQLVPRHWIHRVLLQFSFFEWRHGHTNLGGCFGYVDWCCCDCNQFVKHVRRLHSNRPRPPPSPSSYMHIQHLLQSLNYSRGYMTSAVETVSCQVWKSICWLPRSLSIFLSFFISFFLSLFLSFFLSLTSST